MTKRSGISALCASTIFLLSACNSEPANKAPEPISFDRILIRDPVAIGYDSRGCYGLCPRYKVTVWRDGRGLFVGHEHVSALGVRSFRLSLREFEAFEAWVAPLKPAQGSIPREGTPCNIMDGPSSAIVWEGADGAAQSFCMGSHDQLPDPALARDRIKGIPRLLPIASYISGGD